MKAIYIEQSGGPEVLKYGDLPDPSAGPGQIVLDTFAASVNGADWKVRAGHYGGSRSFHWSWGGISPRGQGGRSGVDDLRIGDEVFGVLEAGREGAYAEKSPSAPHRREETERAVACRRRGAGAHGLTALCSVEDSLKLKSGETILIQGGAGGVASFAIQLAKHFGARVITTASAANPTYLRELGADEVIDYNTTDFTKAVSNCDAVFDTVGGDVALRSFAVLKPADARPLSRPEGRRRGRPQRRNGCGRPSAATGRI